MSDLIDTFTFEFKGRDFIRRTYFDSDHEPPWDDGDGNGIVSDDKSRAAKRPGERPFRGSTMRYFDWQETTAKAKRDDWGLYPDDIAKLEKALGRPPTRKQINRETVQREFDRINSWLNDEWCYVWIEVEDTVTGATESCGGFQSDDEDGISNYARGIANSMYDPPLLVELMDRKLKEIAL